MTARKYQKPPNGQLHSGSHLLLAVHTVQEQTGKADIQRG